MKKYLLILPKFKRSSGYTIDLTGLGMKMTFPPVWKEDKEKEFIDLTSKSLKEARIEAVCKIDDNVNRTPNLTKKTKGLLKTVLLQQAVIARATMYQIK